MRENSNQDKIYLILDTEEKKFWVNKPRGQQGSNTQKRCAWVSRGAAKSAFQTAQLHGSPLSKPGGFDSQTRCVIVEVDVANFL